MGAREWDPSPTTSRIAVGIQAWRGWRVLRVRNLIGEHEDSDGTPQELAKGVAFENGSCAPVRENHILRRLSRLGIFLPMSA